MNFFLSTQQEATRKLFSSFCVQEILPIRDQLETDLKRRKELYRLMAKQKMLVCTVAKKYGGQELDGVSYALALSEISAVDAGVGVAFAVSNWVAEAIGLFGSEEQKKRYLPRFANAELVGGCFALTEEQAGSDIKNLQSKAERIKAGYLLNAKKRWITNGNLADVCIVFARLKRAKGHGITAFLVNRPGWQVSELVEKMGLSTVNLTCLEFANCTVPKENCLGAEGEGLHVALSMLDRGRIGIAAQSFGIATAAYHAAVKHAKTRVQFGRPIGENQVIAFQLADMRVQLEAMRLLTLQAAQLRDQKEPFTEQASIAKLFASEACNRIVEQAVQIHGGYGYVKEYPLERYYRDARATTIYEGTSEIQRLVIARHILNLQGK